MNTLSVVVPVYNVEKYLPRCVESILRQKRRPDEIVLVDDGSTDRSGEICDRYAEEYGCIRAIHQNNQGQSAARNAGVGAATMELIAFVDSDDYIAPEMYADLLEMYDKHGADIVSSGLWVDAPDEQYSRFDAPAGSVFVWNSRDALLELMSFRYVDMAVCNKVYKRSLFARIRFPAGRICEDLRVSYRLFALAGRVVHTTKPYYHYFVRAGSTTQAGGAEKKREYLQTAVDEAKLQQEYICAHHPDLAYAARAYTAFAEIGRLNACVRNGISDSVSEAEARRTVRQSLGCILRSRRIPLIKRLQALALVLCHPGYKAIIKRRMHR